MPECQTIFKPAQARRAQLRLWIDTHCQGLQINFLESCLKNNYELSQSELSGLLKEKSFGEKKARAIEVGAGMPIGFLDQPSTQAPLVAQEPVAQYRVNPSTLDPLISQAVELFQALPAHHREGALAMLRMYIGQLSPPATGQAHQLARNQKRAARP